MKTQYLVAVLTNGMNKKGTIEIQDDKIVLFIDNVENKISFANIRGAYVNNNIMEVVLENDVKMTLNCFEDVNTIYGLFESKKNAFDEKNFLKPMKKKEKGKYKELVKSIFLSFFIVGCLVAILEYQKIAYDRRLIIVAAIFFIVIAIISDVSKKSIKMNLSSKDLIDVVMGVIPNGQKILNEYSTGIIIDYNTGEFCIIKKPFSSYQKMYISTIVSSEVVLKGDEHNCSKLFIKLVISEGGIQKNEFIPFITKKISKSSKEFNSVYDFASNLNTKFQEFVKGNQGSVQINNVNTQAVNINQVSDDSSIDADSEWKIG